MPLSAAAASLLLDKVGALMQNVQLTDGTMVACLHRNEALVLDQHVQGYFSQGVDVLPGDVVFDIGANIGLFGIRAMQRSAGQARVFAFEPIPPIFDVLQANTKSHGGGAFSAYRFGISSNAGQAEFTYFPNTPSLSTKNPEILADNAEALGRMVAGTMEAPPKRLWYTALVPGFVTPLIVRMMKRGAQRISCELRSVSGMIDALQLDRVDVLKVDAEGAELEVLAGIRDEHWARFRGVICEVHDVDSRIAMVCQLFQDKGFAQVIAQHEASMDHAPLAIIFASR